MSSRCTVLKAISSQTISLVDAEELGLKTIRYGTPNTINNSFTDINGTSQSLMENSRGTSGILHQKFVMKWVNDEKTEIEFKGLTGTLEGQQGRPGVVYNESRKELLVNLLLNRPDGSFSIVSNKTLCMIVAPPDQANLPDAEKIHFVKFSNGVKLPQGWWHSVPFPLPGDELIELDEYVTDTNENNVISIAEETGAPMRVQL